jgi:hypothetical protein
MDLRQARRQAAVVTPILGIVGAMIGFFMAASPVASHQSTASHGRACVARVARVFHSDHTRFGNTKATVCRASPTRRAVATAAIPARTNMINVGYGCALKNFSKKGPCWNFAVTRPGCRPGVAIIWPELGAMRNRMKSWKAINSCHSGRIYSRPKLKGRFVTCSAICRGLGKLNDHDVSLVVGWGKTP